MERKICIEDVRIRTKIKSFIKTCDSLLVEHKALDATQQAINAFKVLLRFLKKDNALVEVYEKLNASATIMNAYKEIKTIVENDFCVSLDDKSIDSGKYQVGDIVQFGRKKVRGEEQALSWIVVDVANDKALLFAQKSYLWEAFDTNGGNDWQSSSLRKKLNGAWLEESFSATERAEMVLPEKKCTDGFESDYIFVFTMDEVDRLVPYDNGRSDSKNVWWTASAGETEGTVGYILRSGEKQTEGVVSTKTQGVRPAFWVKNTIENSEETELEDFSVRQPKKLIIVDDASGYYIAYASADENITSEYLRNASAQSAHYFSLEEAEEAVELIKNVGAGKEEFVIERIAMTDLMNKEFEENNQRYVITDKDGIVILYIYAKGKKVFPFREEDGECRHINKIKYQNLVREQLEIQNQSLAEKFDHYTIGKIIGYENVLECDAPHIRYEVFKAENIIESFSEFPEIKYTYVDDEKYYNGYIDAMLHGLELQHKCAIQECHWIIDLIDIRDNEKFTAQFEMDMDIPGYGGYSVRIHNKMPELKLDDGLAHMVIVLANKKNEWTYMDIETDLDLPDDVPLIFAEEKTIVDKTRLSKLIKSNIEEQTTLGNGVMEYTISVELVDTMANFTNLFREDIEDSNFTVEPISTDENKVRAIDLRDSKNIDELFEFRFKDDNILQSIKLPAKMEVLPKGLFYNCNILDFVALPDNLCIISESVFEDCKKLWKLYLPDSVRRIENRAFFGCGDLKSIYLPPNLEYIGSDAFSGCKKIKRIFIPESIQYIAEDAFDDCVALKKVEAPMGFKLPQSLVERAKISYYPVSVKATETDTSVLNNAVNKDDKEYDIAEILNDAVLLLEKYYTSAPGGFASEIDLLSEDSIND